MDLKALQLNCRFSLPPNSLGYCGRNSAPEKFKRCICHGEYRNVASEFSKFIVLNPYLNTISKITKLPKYSYKIVESYWLGNTLLKQAKNNHYKILLNYFKKQGVPNWLIEELKNKEPVKFIPFHLFQILHVGVGRASGSVPFNLNSQSQCMIRWGNVLKIKNNKAFLELETLSYKRNKYGLKKIKKWFGFNPEIVSDIKVGAIASVHWGQIIKILSKSESKNLYLWTNFTLDTINTSNHKDQ